MTTARIHRADEPPNDLPNRRDLLAYMKDLTAELQQLAEVGGYAKLASHYEEAISETSALLDNHVPR